MGVVAIGLALGGAATYGALLHVVNHSLLKGALFLLAGNVLRAYGTTSAAAVRGVGARLPVTAVLLACGTFALGGSPPFGPFVSELVIFLAAVRGAHPWIGAGFIALLGVAFVGLAGSILPMLHGQGEARHVVRRERFLTIAPPLALAAAVLLLGFHVPAPLDTLLHRAAAALDGAAR
jgi:hydrogenase-4 component F